MADLVAVVTKLELRPPHTPRPPTAADLDVFKATGRWPLGDAVRDLFTHFGGARPPTGREMESHGHAIADFLGFGMTGVLDVAVVLQQFRSRIPQPWIPWAHDGQGGPRHAPRAG